MNARAENRQLRETPGAQRSSLDGLSVHDISDGRVNLVHQRHSRDFHRGTERSHRQRRVDCGGPTAEYQNLRVCFGFEAVLRDRDSVGASGKIGDLERTVRFAASSYFEVRGEVNSGDDRFGDYGSGRVSDCAGNGTQSLLGYRESAAGGYNDNAENLADTQRGMPGKVHCVIPLLATPRCWLAL